MKILKEFKFKFDLNLDFLITKFKNHEEFEI